MGANKYRKHQWKSFYDLSPRPRALRTAYLGRLSSRLQRPHFSRGSSPVEQQAGAVFCIATQAAAWKERKRATRGDPQRAHSLESQFETRERNCPRQSRHRSRNDRAWGGGEELLRSGGIAVRRPRIAARPTAAEDDGLCILANLPSTSNSECSSRPVGRLSLLSSLSPFRNSRRAHAADKPSC